MIMKKLILIMALLAAASLPEAKAQWYVGGSLGMNTQLNIRDYTVEFLPEVGYSLGSWNFGTVFNLYWNRSEITGNPDSYLIVGFAPYVEYYFFTSGALSFYAEAGLDVRYNISGTENHWHFNPYLAPGLEYQLAPHWSAVAHLGRLEWDSTMNNLAFNLFANNLSLGLLYTF